MKFEAIIFDLDGTLLDSLEDLANSMNVVLHNFGFPTHKNELYKTMIGDGIEMLVRRAIPKEVESSNKLNDIIDTVKAEYGKRWEDKTRPFAGIEELIDFLIPNGIKLSILSNKPHEFTIITTQKFFPDIPFYPIFGARKGYPKKPDPSQALLISSTLQIPPEKTLFLGDSGTDMQTAKNAGMTPVGVLWGFRDFQELKSAGAVYFLKKPIELTKIFENPV
ncbi:MAG: HAD family hydrolase [Candidatus Riflebacteria bacterium]|nr:HAD family hydrolase [Candidatus Riflebacteria bacterium]